MKFKVLAACAAGIGMLSSASFAGEWEDACVAALEAEGRDSSGCSCLEAEIMENPSLIEEFQALGEIADPQERYDSASSEAQAAMDKCTRS
ncbi:MAG: hypothetical protein DHS20C05_23240 [Hyphococcus sp.]|nr:MAG: hypothetical protein DHS20C05_23240 [Marinicaulis sp.]